jgi:glycosyltransferase involved in cell wall biosynthesis
MYQNIILLPLFNDWETLPLLLREFSEKIDSQLLAKTELLIVNDGSSVTQPQITHSPFAATSVLHLTRNVGHQKAIALGLAFVAAEKPCDNVIVMDSDGEDKPEDVAKLLSASSENPGKIVFAKRTKRQEGLVFQLFYRIYKFVFIMLTGKFIAFGNFSIIPFSVLTKLVHVSEIWNHFSGGVLRSRMPYITIPLSRGSRLAGKSKMSFTNLIVHGLSAVAVHIDTVAVRLLLLSLILVFSAVLGIVSVAVIRFFTDWAIPGWTSFVVLGLSIIFIQALLISLFLVFIVLTYRTQKHFIPALHYRDFVAFLEKIN